MGSGGATGAVGSGEPLTGSTPGRVRLTPEELHAKRVEWGKTWGKVGREIKQAHEQRGQ